MCTARISPTIYLLDARKSNWSAEQEKGISAIYPFDLQPSGLDDYVARTYLQFLWLPNSLMPLTYLVPSLRRAETPSTSSTTVLQPMHALLEPLLLTTRSVTNKYHSELVQILENGGGAGEVEEAMMWYAVEHEKLVGINRLPTVPSPQRHSQDGEEGRWADEKWREQYLERMEQREVQIQILLYMFKLSLPEHISQRPSWDLGDIPKGSSSGKRKRTSKPIPKKPILSDHLEALMDKLAIWQLVGRIDDVFNHGSAPTKKADKGTKDERDWTQIFAEEVVEPHFKMQLPALCKLLRTKVFLPSPFSDTESDATPTGNASPPPMVAPRSPTPYVPIGLPRKTALSRTSSTSFPGASSRAPSLSRFIPSPTHSATASIPSRNLMRLRSSSLSMTLAQEQEERAVAVASHQARKRRGLHREVSMTRVFKNKGKGKNLGADAGDKKDGDASVTVKIEASKVEKTREDKGVMLVDETPIKPRIPSALEETRNSASIAPINLEIGKPTAPIFTEEENQDEMDGSPVVVFGPALGKQDKGRGNYNIFTTVEEFDGSEEEWDKKGNLGGEEKVSFVVPILGTTSKASRKRSRKK